MVQNNSLRKVKSTCALSTRGSFLFLQEVALLRAVSCLIIQHGQLHIAQIHTSVDLSPSLEEAYDAPSWTRMRPACTHPLVLLKESCFPEPCDAPTSAAHSVASGPGTTRQWRTADSTALKCVCLLSRILSNHYRTPRAVAQRHRPSSRGKRKGRGQW